MQYEQYSNNSPYRGQGNTSNFNGNGSIGSGFGQFGYGAGPFGNQGSSPLPAFLNEPLNPGEAVGYPRKSTATERASKSIADQAAEIKDIALRCVIPFGDDDIWAEDAGHGGDEFWKGGGGTGLAADTYSQERYRPVLTQIMDAILAKKKKAVLVLSQDRLWRDVEICDHLIKFFLLNNVRLFDRNGLVDIYTPEGKNSVRNNAIAAAHYREQCSVRSPIGIKRSGANGIVVTDSNTLGFRSGGRYSRVVIHQADEQEIVRRIFRMFLYGETRDGQPMGPMTTDGIANQLAAEGYQWTPDLHSKRGKQRTEHTRDLIYDWQIRRVLTDKRYIGIQVREDKRENRIDEWPCPPYLTSEGNTVVDLDLFHRVQDKINGNKRTGSAGQRKRAMTGLLRCGLCGQGLHLSHAKVNLKEGESYKIPYWKVVRTEQWCWCTHKLPGVREDSLDSYIDEYLAPVMLAELRDHEAASSSAHNPLRAELARLQQEYREIEHKLSEGLKPYFGVVSPQVLQGMVVDLEGKREVSRREIAAVESRLNAADTQRLQEDLQLGLKEIASETRRDIIRNVIRWAAVLPSSEEYPKGRVSAKRDENGLLPPIPIGTVVFLTSYGTYHTAVIERLHTGHTGQRTSGVRPAHAHEVVGGVAEFPDADAFVAGLKRGYDGRKYEYNPFEVLPGYSARSSVSGTPNEVPLATFDVAADVSIGQ